MEMYPRPSRRLDLELSPHAVKKLEELRVHFRGQSTQEIVRQALKFYEKMVIEAEKGNRISVVDRQGNAAALDLFGPILEQDARIAGQKKTPSAPTSVETPTAQSTLIVPERTIFRGRRVELNTQHIRDLAKAVGRNWATIYTIPPGKVEELAAYCYDRDGFEVYLTSGPGDAGRDFVAIRPGPRHPEKIVASVKRYAPTRPVDYDEIRALLAVVNGERDATSGVLITTSFFPPLVGEDPFINPYRPYRLRFIDGPALHEWLRQMAEKH
jgi:restriction system protein